MRIAWFFAAAVLLVSLSLDAQPSPNPNTATPAAAVNSAPVEPQAKFVQITGGTVRVLQALSPDAPVLGLARAGSFYPLLLAGDSWCKISFNGTNGWVERRYVKLVEAPSSSSSSFLRQLVWALGILAGVALILLIMKLVIENLNTLGKRWIKSLPVQKNVLIVAKTDKQITRHLTGAVTTLDKCFAGIGFTVHRARDMEATAKQPARINPHVIVVDWRFDPSIPALIEQIVSSRAGTSHVFVIFYNVPDPALCARNSRLPNAQYLPANFTDRDIFALVTHTVIKGEHPQAIRKSVESSALEGSLTEGSLQEVFQFIEIGQKTGCLLVEDKKPLGLVFFRQGLIVYAATGRAAAKQAVFEILGLHGGRFRFVLDKEPKGANCSLQTLGVLMEWTKELDETHGH